MTQFAIPKKTTVKPVIEFSDAEKREISFDKPTLVWLGDPCYVPEFNDNWDDFCGVLFSMEDDDSHVMSCNGIEFVVGNTAYGDGYYHVSSGGKCGVDAGLLSVIPAGHFGLDANSGNDYGGVFVTVNGRCFIDEQSTVHAGHVNIITQDRCENCSGVEGECGCERCWDCGEFEDWCTCEDECFYCGNIESECTCEEE